jgi:outer membrane protein assembly factor BamD
LKQEASFIISLALILIILAGCGGPAIKPTASAEEQFALAMREYEKENYLKAIDGFQRVIFNFPGATVVDTAQHYLAMSYFGNKDYELAAVEFKRLAANYPRSDFVDKAQFMAGICYYKNTPGHYGLDQEDLKKAIEALQDFMLENPDSPLVEDAKAAIHDGLTKLAEKEYKNGMLYYKMYDYRAARIYFQYVIDNYTDTKYAGNSLFKLSEIVFKERNYVEALEKFNQFINLYPNHEWVPKAEEYVEKITHQLETVDVSDDS